MTTFYNLDSILLGIDAYIPKYNATILFESVSNMPG